MEPLREVELPEINYMERLKKELASCCMPSIKDIGKASTDEITRDTYRVLTGNGDIMGGLIVKVATANTNIQNLQDHMTAVISSTNAQINRCNAVQSKAASIALVEKVKSNMVKTAVKFVWENKSAIGVVFMCVAVLYNSVVTHLTAVSATEERSVTEQLVKKLDAKVTAMVQAHSAGEPKTARTP